jgi:hypothetical protein
MVKAASYTTIRVEVWSARLKTWITQGHFAKRQDADECVRSWGRLNHTARVVEIAHKLGPDWANNRGE